MSTRALIIEDEISAANFLKQLLAEVAPTIEVLAVLPTISASINWLSTNTEPDLIFLDIHLADGLSFSIFRHVNISCPVIFVTAYDQYAIQAFELNSIGYLLKPISQDDLTKAIDKFNKNRKQSFDYTNLLESIMTLSSNEKKYKQNFLIQVKDKLIPVDVSQVTHFYTESKVVRAVTDLGKEYIIENNVEELTSILDPKQFFRANRQFIVNRKFIKEAAVWFNGKLVIRMSIDSIERIEVSKARVSEFKSWLGS